jgi:hypothetical protein
LIVSLPAFFSVFVFDVFLMCVSLNFVMVRVRSLETKT